MGWTCKKGRPPVTANAVTLDGNIMDHFTMNGLQMCSAFSHHNFYCFNFCNSNQCIYKIIYLQYNNIILSALLLLHNMSLHEPLASESFHQECAWDRGKMLHLARPRGNFMYDSIGYYIHDINCTCIEYTML